MFSSSFTMSEQKHRQWTPYKHAAPALTGRVALARPAARFAPHLKKSALGPPFFVRGPRGKFSR